jgi:lysophospholipase L1-like esterase
MLRRAGAWLAVAALGLALFELALQLLALAAPRWLAREPAAAAGAGFRILCIGDSHTYGWGVERQQAWPAQLELRLEEGSRVDFDVVNLGVPSSNSSQVVTRLPRYLARYRPDLLVVTIGGNDVSNFAEREEAAAPVGETPFWWRLRSARLLVYALHQRRRVVAGRAGSGAEVSWSHPWREAELRDGTLVERFEHEVDLGAALGAEEHAALLRGNLERIAAIAEAAGVPLVFASYTHGFHSLGVANRVMQEVGGARFVSQRVQPDLLAAAPELGADAARERLFFEDLHPKAPVYAAAAAHLRDALLREGLVPAASP